LGESQKGAAMQAPHILELAKTYASHTGRRLSTLGAYSVNDGKFFERLRNGGGCTLKTAARVLAWFAANWPADLEWPRHIPRPNAKEAA
jgi:hypothetical protein